MWYEALPSLGLVFGFITIIPITQRAYNYIRYGRTVSKDIDLDMQGTIGNLRHERLTGNLYKEKGLESIPDE